MRIGALRSFYFKVADATKESSEVIDLMDEPDAMIQKVSNKPLGDILPVNWQNQLRTYSESLAQPVELALILFSYCISKEPSLPNCIVCTQLCRAYLVVCTSSQRTVSS